MRDMFVGVNNTMFRDISNISKRYDGDGGDIDDESSWDMNSMNGGVESSSPRYDAWTIVKDD